MLLCNERISEKIIWLLVTTLFASFTIFIDSSIGSIILFFITLFILFIDIYQNNWKFKFRIERFHIFVLLFAFFCIVSSLWSIRGNESIQKGITIFEILICLSVIYAHYSKNSTIKPLITSVMWAGYIVVVYAFIFYGIDTIQTIVSTGERLENSFANINEIGILASMSIIITLFKVLFMNKKLSLEDILVVPCIIMVAASGSRKALLISAIGIIYLVIVRFSTKNILKNIVIWTILGIVLFLLISWVSNLPIFEGVMSRMQGLENLLSGSGKVDHSAWLRQQYIKVGMGQFYKHPLIGIGMGSSGAVLLESFGRDTYFHNNYVEILASGGIVGFFVHYGIYFYIVKEMIKNKKNKDMYFYISFILIFILLFMDYASVSYYSKSQYFYFVILFLQVKLMKSSKRLG